MRYLFAFGLASFGKTGCRPIARGQFAWQNPPSLRLTLASFGKNTIGTIIHLAGHSHGAHLSGLPDILKYGPACMNTYVKFAILIALVVGSLVWLAVGGVKETKTYYKTIPELAQMGKSAQGQRLRVGGDIQPGSIVKNGAQVSFVLHQGAQKLNVVYSGNDPLPDTFRDNAQALADGRLGPDGVFEASKIQAKCASKYESKPAQRGLTHGSAAPKVSS